MFRASVVLLTIELVAISLKSSFEYGQNFSLTAGRGDVEISLEFA